MIFSEKKTIPLNVELSTVETHVYKEFFKRVTYQEIFFIHWSKIVKNLFWIVVSHIARNFSARKIEGLHSFHFVMRETASRILLS